MTDRMLDAGVRSSRCAVRIAVLLVATGCAPGATEELPEFLEQLTEQFEAASASDSPGSIWRYSYEGRTVYYVPPLSCCDHLSTLYDADGAILCAPDGGLTGDGDGSCSDFFELRSAGHRVWRDARVSTH